MHTIQLDQLSNVTGGNQRLTEIKNAAKGFVGGLACLGKFAVDGKPGNSYDRYLACQRAAHAF